MCVWIYASRRSVCLCAHLNLLWINECVCRAAASVSDCSSRWLNHRDLPECCSIEVHACVCTCECLCFGLHNTHTHLCVNTWQDIKWQDGIADLSSFFFLFFFQHERFGRHVLFLRLAFQTTKFTHSRKSASIKSQAPTLLRLCFFVSYVCFSLDLQMCGFFVLSVRNFVSPAIPLSYIHPNPLFQRVMERAVWLFTPSESEREAEGDPVLFAVILRVCHPYDLSMCVWRQLLKTCVL